MVIVLFHGIHAFLTSADCRCTGFAACAGVIPFGGCEATEAVAFAMDFSSAQGDSQSRHQTRPDHDRRIPLPYRQ
jgi:hypothetical protein